MSDNINSLDIPLSILGGLSARTFLADYWQKKPLLIRAGLTDFDVPLDADELAGMAMENEVESRIVIEKGQVENSDKTLPWHTLKGPFTEEDFADLPEQEWTLLVQAVDHWIPEIQALKERFHFLPSWRLDDVMASYATTGGSVGPHYDQYDVFLVQVAGKRHWQVLAPTNYKDAHLANTELHILENFTPMDYMDWEVETGDILYIPPNFAHYGRALDNDCMTYSIGFRAPSMQDALRGISDKICEVVDDKQRFAAPSDNDEPHHAEIHSSDISYLQTELNKLINKPDLLADWLANHMSEVKYPEYHADLNQADTEQNLQAAIDGVLFFRPGDARICYRQHIQHNHIKNSIIEKNDDTEAKLSLYCNGSHIELTAELESLIQVICDQSEFDFSGMDIDKHKDILPMLSFLISKQGLIPQQPSDD